MEALKKYGPMIAISLLVTVLAFNGVFSMLPNLPSGKKE